MVKKKGQSKRISLKDKYKVERRVVQTHRKNKKIQKREKKAGIVKHHLKKKDPGIPNSWPFKNELLNEIARAKERAAEAREKKKQQNRGLVSAEENESSNQANKTLIDLVGDAQRSQAAFDAKVNMSTAKTRPSRRFYLRECKKVIEQCDVLLQVLDARDPEGTRIDQAVEDAILSRTDKSMVLILNKADLVPSDVLQKWVEYLKKKHPTVAFTKKQSEFYGKNLLSLLKNYARSGGVVTVGVVGYPNVGKSSLINSLKRGSPCGTSPRPGFTTSLQEVVLDSSIRLIDSPGVVFCEKSEDSCGVDVDRVEDPVPYVEALLKKATPRSLIMAYKIPLFTGVDMFLSMVAKVQGKVTKGGVPNKRLAARGVLRDWNNGTIPYFTPPPTTASASVDITVVSSLGDEFHADDEKNSIDYVQLRPHHERERSESSQVHEKNEMVDMLMNDDDDDNADAMETDTNTATTSIPTNAEMEHAKDYDFAAAMS